MIHFKGGEQLIHLRQQWQEETQEEEQRPLPPQAGSRCRQDGSLSAGPVAERGVTAGDADRVEPAGAELLVARGGDKARPRGRARLPIMYSCTTRDQNKEVSVMQL